MINETNAKKFCREDISKIENYDKAIADITQMWHCHHRDEIRTLPSGMIVVRSRQDLKDTGRYYGCPANELIFLTKSEHRKLHNVNMRDETRQKIGDAQKGKIGIWKGKTFNEEHKKKMSESMKGEKNPLYGKKHSDETRRKMREAWAKRKGIIK